METELSNVLKLKTKEKVPLSVSIYEEIKLAIIDGKIPPQFRLTETSIAEQMGVSATPVREAFRRLAAEGLVKIIPWKGAIVQSYSEDEIKETYQCRIALEVLAIRLAVQNIDEEGIKKLENVLQKSEQVQTATDVFENNSEIHDIILEYAYNKKLKQFLENINDLIRHDRNITSYNIERTKNIHKEHVQIVEAIKERDILKAEEAMRTHIENGYKYIIQQRLKKREDEYSL